VAVLAACGSSPSGGGGGKSPIQIGVVLAQTGGAAPFGLDEYDGFSLYINHVNSTGGVQGHQIQITRRDDQSTPAGALTGFQEVASDSNTIAIIGPDSTSMTLAAMPAITENNVPTLGFVATSSLASTMGPDWFRSTFNDQQQIQAILTYLKQIGDTKVTFLSSNDTVGQSAETQFTKQAPTFGIQIAATILYPEDIVDPTVQVLQAKDSNAQAYIVWDVTDAVRLALVVKTMRDEGITQPIGSSLTAGENQFLQAAGQSAAEGVFYWASIAQDQPLPGTQTTVAKQYEAYAGHPPDDPNLGGYTMAQILVEAISRTLSAGKAVTRANIRTAIEGLHDFATAYGILNYSPTNHGTPFTKLVIAIYKNGQRVLATQVTSTASSG
jgi:branched-chain amino acid transport system substrate-binding protein